MNKNIGSMRTKGVNIKIIPQCTTFHKTQNLRFVDAAVIEFRFFNQIKKNMKNLGKLNIIHIQHEITSNL